VVWPQGRHSVDQWKAGEVGRLAAASEHRQAKETEKQRRGAKSGLNWRPMFLSHCLCVVCGALAPPRTNCGRQVEMLLPVVVACCW